MASASASCSCRREHDPDSFVREHGKEAFEQLLRDALPLSGYLLRELSAQVDLRTQEGRSALLQRAQATADGDHRAGHGACCCARKWRRWPGVTQAELEALYAIKPIGAPPRRAPAKSGAPGSINMRVLLRCLLLQPELARKLPAEFAADGADAAAITGAGRVVAHAGRRGEHCRHDSAFSGHGTRSVIGGRAGGYHAMGRNFDVAAEFEGVLARLRNEAAQAAIAGLDMKIAWCGLKGLDEQERTLYLQLLQAMWPE